MRILSLYILLLVPTLSYTQLLNNSSLYYLDSATQIINIQGQSYLGSTHLPLNFAKIFYTGGFIDDNMINKANSGLSNLNRTGYESSFNITYLNYRPSILKKYGYYLNVSALFSGGAEYTDDFFRGVFQGNTSYKGEYINLQQSGFHTRSYRSIESGIITKKFKVGLCYTNIQSEINSQIYEGGIDISPNATQIQGNFNGYATSSNNSSNFPTNNWGLTINFEITNKINRLDSSSNARIIAGINGFGIQKLSNSSYLYLDTTISYTGIPVYEISDFNTPFLPNYNIDSLSRISTQINAFPFELYVHKVGGKKTAKLHSCYGLRYRSNSNYSVLIYAGGEYHFKNHFTLGSIISYGGYSGVNNGLYIRYQSKKIISSINTNNLVGIFWNQSKAIGLNLSLSYLLQ